MKDILIPILKQKTKEALNKLKDLDVSTMDYTTCLSNLSMNLQLLQAQGVTLTKEDLE